MLQGILTMLAERMGIIGKAAWRCQDLETMICDLGNYIHIHVLFRAVLKMEKALSLPNVTNQWEPSGGGHPAPSRRQGINYSWNLRGSSP